MTNPFQVTSASDIGQPVALISQSNQNHHPTQWAAASAKMILNTDALSGDRLRTAMALRGKVEAILVRVYNNVIKREIDHLNTFLDHCDSDYDVAHIAECTAYSIRDVAIGTPWAEALRGAEWSASAWLTIANHLSTAIHVERLLFADLHADNKAAVAYKARFTG